MTFVDIAGIVKGASEGAGLGNRFLSHIRESDAICQVIRVFSDPDVVHVDGRVSPSDDIEVVNLELILADLQTLDRAILGCRRRPGRTRSEQLSWPRQRRRRSSWRRAGPRSPPASTLSPFGSCSC